MPPRRSAAAAAGPASAPAPDSKRQRSGRSSLAEGALNGDDAAKEIAAHAKARAFWEQFDTRLLAEWLDAFDGHGLSPAQLASRPQVIDALVTKGASMPKGRTADAKLADMQKHWYAATDTPPASGSAPGRVVAPAFSLAPAGGPPAPAPNADDSEGDEEDEEEDDSGGRGPVDAHARSVPSPAQFAMTPGRRAVPIPHHTQCRSCLAPNASGHASWICDCGARGDLAPEHSLNIVRAQMRLAEINAAARGSAPASTAAVSSSSSSGQSNTDTSVRALTAASALDKKYTDWATDTSVPFIAEFSSGAAGVPLTHTKALNDIRRAYGGTSAQRPSVPLINAIRAGRLFGPGHAVPRAIPLGLTGDTDAGVASLQNGLLTVTSARATVPDACASASQLANAILSTILPALIDRPAAMLQWMMLGRSALSIDEKYGWAVASEYVAQTLTDRIGLGQELGSMNQEVFTQVTAGRVMSSGAARPHLAQGAQQGARHASVPGVCNDFNNRSCNRAVCNFKHLCRACGVAGHSHADESCPSHSTWAPPRSQQQFGHRGSGGGFPRPANSRGGGSVTTARPKSSGASAQQ
jgi:hypothetical protein